MNVERVHPSLFLVESDAVKDRKYTVMWPPNGPPSCSCSSWNINRNRVLAQRDQHERIPDCKHIAAVRSWSEPMSRTDEPPKSEGKRWKVVAARTERVQLEIEAPNPTMRDVIAMGTLWLMDQGRFNPDKSIKVVKEPTADSWSIREAGEIRDSAS